MYAFYYATILILQAWLKIGFATECACQPRTAVDVLLQQLEGLWYTVAMINETNVSEQRSCITMDYRYDYCREVARTTRTSILNNSTQMESNTATLIMITPGILDMTYICDGGEVNYHDHYLEFTPGVSFIQTTCQRNNQSQTLFTDRIALLMSTRNVDDATIEAKFNSIGISIGGNNQFYRVSQENCPN